jgi:integrase
MVKVDLRGIAKVKAKDRTYCYAWRGGPRLRGKPGSPEFILSYQEAHEDHRMPDTDRFRSLVVLYKASPDFKKLADSTKKKWGPWLDCVGEYFGNLRIAQFDRREKIRPIILRWRNQWADKPRTADYAMQVLSCVLSHAVDPLGKIAGNPCDGIKHLYHVDRSSIIWTDADLSQLKRTCSAEIAHAVDLASHTGLRLGDLLRLSWSHIGNDAIIITTGKSNHRREAVIPLYDDLKSVLSRIPKRCPTILTNGWGRPWKVTSFATIFGRVKTSAGVRRELHFHDLRGTAATRFYLGKLPERVIAEIMGWEEERVTRIIRRYVGRSAATKQVIKLLNEKGT